MIFYEVIFYVYWDVQHYDFMLTWNYLFNRGLFVNIFRFDWEILWKMYSMLTGTHMDWDSQIVYHVSYDRKFCIKWEWKDTKVYVDWDLEKVYVDWDLENVYVDWDLKKQAQHCWPIRDAIDPSCKVPLRYLTENSCTVNQFM